MGVFACALATACGPSGGQSTPPANADSPSASAPHSHDETGHPPHGGHAHHGGHHRFENPEQWSKVFDDAARDEWQRPADVVREMRLSPSDTVADLGCGTGYFVPRLARAVPEGEVIAVDIEPSMLEWVDRRAEREGVTNVATVLATTDDPKFPGAVDAVLIVDTYHHLSDRSAYFRRLQPSLTDGAEIVIVDFRMGKLPVGPPDPLKVAPAVAEREMKAAGYELCRQYDALPYQYVLVFSLRCADG